MRKRSPLLSFTFVSKAIAIALVTYVGLYLLGTAPQDHHHDNKKTYFPFFPSIRNWVADTGPQDETIDQTIDTITDNIQNDIHPSADINAQNSLTKICTQYKSICNKTDFASSDFSDRQKLYYQVLTIYALKKLGDMGIPAAQYVDNITIKSSSTRTRGYSSRNQIVLDTKIMNGYSEFLRVLVHELGHIIDFRYLEGQQTSLKDNVYTEFGKKVFAIDDPSINFYKISWINENTRSRTATYKDFVSGYSMSNIFEDFAEAVHFYLNYRDIFQTLSQQSDALSEKYQFMDTLFGGQYLNNGEKKKSQFEEYNRDFRPYDSTRF